MVFPQTKEAAGNIFGAGGNVTSPSDKAQEKTTIDAILVCLDLCRVGYRSIGFARASGKGSYKVVLAALIPPPCSGLPKLFFAARQVGDILLEEYHPKLWITY